jgi:hypothetical protein
LKKKVKFESGTVPLQKVKLEPGSSDAVGQDEFGQKPPKPRKLSLVLGDIMAHELNGAAGLSPDSDVATEQGAVSLTQALEEVVDQELSRAAGRGGPSSSSGGGRAV